MNQCNHQGQRIKGEEDPGFKPEKCQHLRGGIEASWRRKLMGRVWIAGKQWCKDSQEKRMSQEVNGQLHQMFKGWVRRGQRGAHCIWPCGDCQ